MRPLVQILVIGEWRVNGGLISARGFSQSLCMLRTLRGNPSRDKTLMKFAQSFGVEREKEGYRGPSSPDASDAKHAGSPNIESTSGRRRSQTDAGFAGTYIFDSDKSSGDGGVMRRRKTEIVGDRPKEETQLQSEFRYKHASRKKGEVEVIKKGGPLEQAQSRPAETVSRDLLEMKLKKSRGPEPWKRGGGGDMSRERKPGKPHHKRSGGDGTFAVARGNDLLFGISPTLLALQSRRRQIHNIYVTPAFVRSPRTEVGEIQALAEKQDLRVVQTSREGLDRMTRRRPHQGICMDTSRLYFEPVQEEREDTPRALSITLALDQIKDPMNLGALLRSAYFLGVSEVIVSKRNCCSLTPVVSKASSGVMEILPVQATTDLPSYLRREQSRGWKIVGASLKTMSSQSAAVPCHEFIASHPIILVIGSEGFGLSDDVQRLCSELISVPAGRQLHPGIDSLNVSVATGILLHALLGGRTTSQRS